MAGRMKIKVTDEVAKVLRESTLGADRLTLPPAQLARPLYDAVMKVIGAAGGKWNKSAKAHLFPEGTDPREVFSEALETGSIEHTKNVRQAFYTPPDVAVRVIEAATIGRDHLVLEPSAGGGALVDAVTLNEFEAITAIEMDPQAAALLTKSCEGCDDIQVLIGDFLSFEPCALGSEPTNDKQLPRFDRVVMNPPFTGGQDIQHIRHAFSFLWPGGRLVSVVPTNVLSNTSRAYAEFRKWLDGPYTADWEWIKLPAGSFAASGTQIDTALLVIDKAE